MEPCNKQLPAADSSRDDVQHAFVASNCMRTLLLMRSCCVVHRRGSFKGPISGRSIRASYPYWPLWLLYFALGLNAWAASMAFHARDVRRTEARAQQTAAASLCKSKPLSRAWVGHSRAMIGIPSFCTDSR